MIFVLLPLAVLAAFALGSSSGAPVRSAAAPVSALGTMSAFLRAGQAPPLFVAQLAQEEARAIGDPALAASIHGQWIAPRMRPASNAPAAVVAPIGPTAPAPDLDLEPMTSPLPGVPDELWMAFAQLLVREPVIFDSGRRVGRYAASKTRLAEIGIDPEQIVRSANAQDMALCADLADAYHHLEQSGTLAKFLGRPVAIPDAEHPSTISLSGLLGVASVAGLEGALGWLTKKDERRRFPQTTNLFLRTNGVF